MSSSTSNILAVPLVVALVVLVALVALVLVVLEVLVVLVVVSFFRIFIFSDFIQLFQVFMECNVALEISLEVRRCTPRKSEKLVFSRRSLGGL